MMSTKIRGRGWGRAWGIQYLMSGEGSGGGLYTDVQCMILPLYPVYRIMDTVIRLATSNI